jgi:hypothetical protein
MRGIERFEGMNCNAKTMIKVAAVLGVGLAVAYVALPEARALVAASAPILLALVCPIAMVVMMFMMKRTSGDKQDVMAAKPDEGKARGPALKPQPGPDRA